MFRVVYSGLRAGSYNTAMDEALLSGVRNNATSNTIVITEWEPTVSVGRTQSIQRDIDAEACRKRYIGIVRRHSGGKSAYLDSSYINFSIIAADARSGKGYLHDLRHKPCYGVIRVLNRYGIPASFEPPDNIVVKNGSRTMTLGNSGQKVARGYFYLHGSVRYDLPDESFDNLISTLRNDGEPLHAYADEARKVLAAVADYSSVPKCELEKAIAESLAKEFGDSVYEGSFTRDEEKAIEAFAENITKPEWLEDTPACKSRGVCYFFVGGENLLPMKMRYNPPSTPMFF